MVSAGRRSRVGEPEPPPAPLQLRRRARPNTYTVPGRSSLPSRAGSRPLHVRATLASLLRKARRLSTPAPCRLHALPRESRPPGVQASHWPRAPARLAGTFARPTPLAAFYRAPGRRELGFGKARKLGRGGVAPGGSGERSAKPRGTRWRKALRTDRLAVLGRRRPPGGPCAELQPGLGAVADPFLCF